MPASAPTTTTSTPPPPPPPSPPPSASGSEGGPSPVRPAPTSSLLTVPWIGRALHTFHPHAMTPFARRNYQHELVAVTSWPVAVAVIESAVTSVIAEKAFAGVFPTGETPGWIIATLATAAAFSNVSSFLWTRLAHGQATVRNLNILQTGILALIVAMAFIPLTLGGVYFYVAAAVATRMLMAGVVTLRSVLWRANYLRAERARITGKLMTIQAQVIAASGVLVGVAMDVNESAFRLLYPIAAAVGFIGVTAYSRLRIRHPHHLRVDDPPHRAPIDRPTGPGATARVVHATRHAVRAFGNLGSTIAAMYRVLRDDLAFRGFMVCMFIMGLSNLASMPALVRLTASTFELPYFQSLLVLQTIPLGMLPIGVPFWSWMFERMHVIRFRVFHSWCFVIAHLLFFTAAQLHSMPILLLAAAVKGFAFGGGALAWNIGHNDFAPREKAGLYMTVHVTLTGIRGLIGGYFGVMVYSGLVIAGHQMLPVPPLEDNAFLLFAALGATGALGFLYLDFRVRHLTGAGPATS